MEKHLNKKDWDIILDCLYENYFGEVTGDIPLEDIEKTKDKVEKLIHKEQYIHFDTLEEGWKYLNS